jgi:uridine kinase
MPQSPTIIAFAGPPGAGKSALIQALARRMPQAATLFMDHFDIPARMDLADLARWRGAGADFGALEVVGLAEALSALKGGGAATEPLSGRRVGPASLVLFEAPLGRAHDPSARHIDRLVWIDTPLDVALARNIQAWHAEPEPPPAAWLQDYMGNYLAVTRDVLLAQRAVVMPGADLVLDGVASPDDLADQVVEALESGAW